MERTLLIIDDDENEILLEKMLISGIEPGIRIEEASSGERALALLKKEEQLPALIFLDLKMPGMGGIKTLRLLRADERLKKLPVIVFTNSSLELDRQEVYEAGADDFIQKPFEMDILRNEIKSLLEHYFHE